MKALEVREVSKMFPGNLANDRISFSVEKGEIFAIVGENGAGKTTLMNIIYGIYTPSAGTIFVNEKEVKIHSVEDAIRLRMGMVHQEFMLIPRFSVTENIVVGDEPRKGIFFDYTRAVREVRELSERVSLTVDAQATTGDLPVGIQQRVEILKVLRRGAEILIFDEPTAVLTPEETADLFVTMRKLQEEGKTILFISHKLKEVMEIADRIAVLRRGKLQGIVNKKDTNEEELARMMVGRNVVLEIPKLDVPVGDVAFACHDLHVKNSRGYEALKGVSFEVRGGEIVGVAGVQGNGQDELVNAMIGFSRPVSGSMELNRKSMHMVTTAQLRKEGMSYITEDRARRGLVMPYTVRDNAIMGQHLNKPFSRGLRMDYEKVAEFAEGKVKEYDIRPGDIYDTAGSLSGGNQQKLILARELSLPHNFLIASQPTRGLDVGATEFVYGKLLEEKKAGKAILLISLELSEILGLSDRILVMFDGHIVGETTPDKTTEEALGLLMLGVGIDRKVQS
ncbi:ABC transporter ATP-binding protein [bacterium]|nr:ABC transporter ATP-binding protein [bacterium]